MIRTLLTRQSADGTFTAHLHGTCGDLVVALHGFPDLPGSFDPVLPALLGAGYRVLVPVMRGYETGSVQPEGRYHALCLADDLIAWLDYLGEDSASLIGHDWGAVAGWAAIARASHRFRCFVALAIPHTGAFMKALPVNPRQWAMSWYMSFFQWPLLPERALADPRGAFIRQLWRQWSPGWTPPAVHLQQVVDCLSDAAIGAAALGYYRCLFRPWQAPNREWLLMTGHSPRVPVLALAGERDGCVRARFFTSCMQTVEVAGLVDHAIVPGTGHFLHMEDPDAVMQRILPFLARWRD